MAIPKLRSHFKPHKRVTEDGMIELPHGELIRPPSMTKQEFVREADINNILKQYSVTGMLNHVSANAAAGAYQDLPDAFDFQESLHQVQAAERAFMTLPAKLRARFDNEPSLFLAFATDPANLAEMRTLGLAKPLPPEPPPPLGHRTTSPPGRPQSPNQRPRGALGRGCRGTLGSPLRTARRAV